MVDGRRTNAALGLIDDPAKTDIIRRIADDGEIRERIPDLFALIEAVPADHTVGHAHAHEGALNRVRLGVHPVKHRMVTPLLPPLDRIHDGIRDKGALLLLVKGVIHDDLFPGAIGCPEIFALSLGIMGDHSIGCVQNILRGAVILFETDHLCLLILLLEREDIFNRCAAEAVNTLVVVTDHAEVAAAAGQKAGEPVLRMVGILILVDHHIAEAVLIAGAHLLILFQELYCVNDDIVEVHRVRIPEQLLIEPVGFTDLPQAHVVACILQVFLW